ncbi:L-aminoadipate-semialdehyde dehydrogenase-phosphopantetheinyl transferase [Orussus abietinus]|uniref:L-aminoadipate-semialdehyde dehydrogenase-phosphopantetheinyl transferase n=1 Tax=Orussus abietinus TaxID=222816 RepID=UPI000C7161D1|nr:L-aminoadipate-semialdehyde dehydrogenase-phosphopantetheinyl transferase [Orussus abietinus]XP_023289266.1 L-aminoadipate-semialdehyde dehydrogenase-phosphopantetheinyl transferase [Orussus abietinus]
MSHTSIRWAFNWASWQPTEKELLHAISCLQLEEKERIGRFVFRKDARASLIGRLLMRKFVNKYTDIPYNEIIFTRDPNAKPILKYPQTPINFNVSHQGSYTVLAGEVRNVKLGVDVMKLEYSGGKNLSEFFRIMNRNFSVSEWLEIKGSPLKPPIEQVAMFCRHWSLKESFVKALGTGITVDLKRIDFKTNSQLTQDRIVIDTELYLDGIKQNWLFEETLLDTEHCVSVALQENGVAPPSSNRLFQKLDFNELIADSIPLFSNDLEFCRMYFIKREQP